MLHILPRKLILFIWPSVFSLSWRYVPLGSLFGSALAISFPHKWPPLTPPSNKCASSERVSHGLRCNYTVKSCPDQTAFLCWANRLARLFGFPNGTIVAFNCVHYISVNVNSKFYRCLPVTVAPQFIKLFNIECEMCPYVFFSLGPELWHFVNEKQRAWQLVVLLYWKIMCVHLMLLHEVSSDWMTSKFVLLFYTF